MLFPCKTEEVSFVEFLFYPKLPIIYFFLIQVISDRLFDYLKHGRAYDRILCVLPGL